MNLVSICVMLLVILTTSTLRAQTTAVFPGAKLPDHPRLLLLGGEEERIHQAIISDPAWAKVHGAILSESDRLLQIPVLERTQIGRRLLTVSRDALGRMLTLGYAYRMTRNRTYLDRATKELLAVSAFSDWNPSHFLDVAEMTMAVAIGYDWLYSQLSAQSRATIRQAILQKGLAPSLDPQHNTWLTATHNWNQVCNAGMTFGALAVYEEQPEASLALVNRAIETVVLSMNDYAPDGAYPEGYGYWAYGTSFNVLLISALEKAFGTDFGLASQPGFLKTAGYMANMAGPTGLAFNYSDSGESGSVQPAMFWFAKRLNDPSLLWVERGRLVTTSADKLTKNRLLPTLMIWGDGVRLAEGREPGTLLWAGQGKNPVALLRSSWADPAAVFVGLKAGSPSVNHGHMDIGSFVMEADGVRWAVDLGAQDYNSLESRGMNIWGKDQNAQRWQVYRYNNLAHNTLTINEAFQTVTGYASVSASGANPAFRWASTDLSSVYAGAVARAVRGIALIDNAHVLVQDELRAPAAETTLRWTMLTGSTVKLLANNQAELTQNGKKLVLKVQQPLDAVLTTAPATSIHDYDAPNPGITRISFEVRLSPNSESVISVLLLPEKAAVSQETRPFPLTKSIKDWK